MIWKLVQLTPDLRVKQYKEFSHCFPDALHEGTWLASDGEVCWSIEQLRQHLTLQQDDMDHRTEIESVINILECMNEFCAADLRNMLNAGTEFDLNANWH